LPPTAPVGAHHWPSSPPATEADFCVEALQEAIARHGRPEIFNTDQGVQFTSAGFLEELESRGIRVSMDGKGRLLDIMFIVAVIYIRSGNIHPTMSHPVDHIGKTPQLHSRMRLITRRKHNRIIFVIILDTDPLPSPDALSNQLFNQPQPLLCVW
jgi:hypothetical protein